MTIEAYIAAEKLQPGSGEKPSWLPDALLWMAGEIGADLVRVTEGLADERRLTRLASRWVERALVEEITPYPGIRAEYDAVVGLYRQRLAGLEPIPAAWHAVRGRARACEQKAPDQVAVVLADAVGTAAVGALQPAGVQIFATRVAAVRSRRAEGPNPQESWPASKMAYYAAYDEMCEILYECADEERKLR